MPAPAPPVAAPAEAPPFPPVIVMAPAAPPLDAPLAAPPFPVVSAKVPEAPPTPDEALVDAPPAWDRRITFPETPPMPAAPDAAPPGWDWTVIAPEFPAVPVVAVPGAPD